MKSAPGLWGSELIFYLRVPLLHISLWPSVGDPCEERMKQVSPSIAVEGLNVATSQGFIPSVGASVASCVGSEGHRVIRKSHRNHLARGSGRKLYLPQCLAVHTLSGEIQGLKMPIYPFYYPKSRTHLELEGTDRQLEAKHQLNYY